MHCGSIIAEAAIPAIANDRKISSNFYNDLALRQLCYLFIASHQAGCENNTVDLRQCKGVGWIYVVWKLKKTITSIRQLNLHAYAFCAMLLAGGTFEDTGVYNKYDIAENHL